MILFHWSRPDNPVKYLRDYFAKLERESHKGARPPPLSPDEFDDVESPVPPVQPLQVASRVTQDYDAVRTKLVNLSLLSSLFVAEVQYQPSQ